MITWTDELIGKLFSLREGGMSYQEIAEVFNRDYDEADFTDETVGRKFRHLRNAFAELLKPTEEIVANSEKLARSLQKEKDVNRLERTSWRKLIRKDNFLEDYNKEIISLLKDISKSTSFYSVEDKFDPEKDLVGIIHLTDLHLNETVSQADNVYDIDVAAKRLQKFANKAKETFKAKGITKVVIACTGDIIGSDRRVEEKLTMATNRAQAVFIAFKLLSLFIYFISKDFEVTVFAVAGNEARVQEEYSYSSVAASDNYDMTIHNMLYYFYENTPVKVILGHPSELVFAVNNSNFLMLHGCSLPMRNTVRRINEVIAKYNKQGVNIRYVLFGHYHEAEISNFYGKGGSLVGNNGYASYALNLSSRASQNIYIVSPNGSVDGMMIDLQDTDNIEGFNIEKEKELYGLKKAVNKVVQIFNVG